MNRETKRAIAETMIYLPMVLLMTGFMFAPLVICWGISMTLGLIATGVYGYIFLAWWLSQ